MNNMISHDSIEHTDSAGSLKHGTERLHTDGYNCSFRLEKGALRCLETGETFKPEELSIAEILRFEGKSDPDDMSVVYALESSTGTKGTLTDAFGAYASPEMSEFIALVPDRRTKRAA